MRPRHFTAVLADVIGTVPEDQTDLRADLAKLDMTARLQGAGIVARQLAGTRGDPY